MEDEKERVLGELKRLNIVHPSITSDDTFSKVVKMPLDNLIELIIDINNKLWQK